MNTLTTFKQKKAAQGFTLIELMIAIAIVGVLAAVAVPQFTDYLGRARAVEAVNLANGCKTGFTEFNASRGGFPQSLADSGCQTIVTENVSAIAINTAAPIGVMVTLANAAPVPTQIRGYRIYLQPLASGATPALATAGGVIAGWQCGVRDNTGANLTAGAAAFNLIPSTCRNNPL